MGLAIVYAHASKRFDEARPMSETRRVGRIEAAFQKMFTRSARVTAVEPVGTRFRLITLGGDALKQVAWTPGDKLQLMFGGWMQRTYTPIEWDALNGRTRLLAFMHGESPGSRWARDVRAGDDCTLFGPRRSVDLPAVTSPAFVFGDETTLGLAMALGGIRPALSPLTICLEMTPADDLDEVKRLLGLGHIDTYLRRDDDTHLSAIEDRATQLLKACPSTSLVLTGKSTSIQRLRRALRETGDKASSSQNKAYWAPGKTGLD